MSLWKTRGSRVDEHFCVLEVERRLNEEIGWKERSQDREKRDLKDEFKKTMNEGKERGRRKDMRISEAGRT